MISTLSDAGIRLSAHGTFSESFAKSIPENEENGKDYTNKKLAVERYVRRRAIVVLTKAGEAPSAIAALIGTSKCSVFRWKNRCSQINNYHDLPRSGRSPSYTEDIKLKLVAFYCQKRPLPGCGRWSYRWAYQHLKVNSEYIGKDIPSKSTIQRILASNSLKPHRTKYFLHITDPDFFPKTDHLTALYKNPPANLFFFDECPGIQILQRLTPDVQTEETQIRMEEFEYIRNGTMDVFAFLNYHDGKILAKCRCDHKTDTFLKVFRMHVEAQSSPEELHYVMDNLSTHRSYAFCQAVAELSEVQCPQEKDLNNLSKRMEWLQKADKRIVIHFTPYHGSWLNLVEIWFGILGAKVLGESYNSPKNIKEAIYSFVIEWNNVLAHPFCWTYDGRGLHEKAVTRFTKMLENSVKQMELRILTKMFMLMANLLKDYMKEVPGNVWSRLAETIFEQHTAINELIQEEEGPKRKEKAFQALNSLMEALKQYLGMTLNGC